MTGFESLMVWMLMMLLTLTGGWTLRSFMLFMRQERRLTQARKFAG